MGKSVKTPRTRTTSVPELAAFAGVSRHTIYEWAKLPGYPKADDGSVDLWALAEWRIKYTSGRDEDLDLNGFDSPNLERLRAAKADRAELELAVLKKEFFPLSWANDFIGGALCGLVRLAGERLERDGNEHGAEVLRQTLQEMESRITQERRATGYRLEGGDDDDEDFEGTDDGR